MKAHYETYHWRRCGFGGLVLVVGFAALARFATFQAYLFSYDESFSWRMMQNTTVGIMQRLQADANPPLHYLLLKCWTGCFGGSLASMRSLSVGLGIGAVGLLYYLSACVMGFSRSRWSYGNWTGPILVSVFAASLVPQIQSGITARMYSLGTLLAVMTACLLYQALQANSSSAKIWWCAYGVTAALFCYTHYFALFTVMAQGLYVIGSCLTTKALWPVISGIGKKRVVTEMDASATLCESNNPWSELKSIGGWCFGASLATILFLPWVPSFCAQWRDVNAGWWVPAITPESIRGVAFVWLTGMNDPGGVVSAIWFLLLGSVIALTILRGGRAAWFFGLQAFVPWSCTLVLSLLGNASLLQLRYLVFAQVSLCGFWGISWLVMASWIQRCILLVLIGFPCVSGLVAFVNNLQEGRPGIAKACEFLADEYEDGDWFIEQDYRRINQVRYYTTEAGLPWLAIKARLNIFQTGHTVHLASLEDEEIFSSEAKLWDYAPARVWRVSKSAEWTQRPMPQRRLVLHRIFEGKGTRYALSLFVKE